MKTSSASLIRDQGDECHGMSLPHAGLNKKHLQDRAKKMELSIVARAQLHLGPVARFSRVQTVRLGSLQTSGCRRVQMHTRTRTHTTHTKQNVRTHSTHTTHTTHSTHAYHRIALHCTAPHRTAPHRTAHVHEDWWTNRQVGWQALGRGGSGRGGAGRGRGGFTKVGAGWQSGRTDGRVKGWTDGRTDG